MLSSAKGSNHFKLKCPQLQRSGPRQGSQGINNMMDSRYEDDHEQQVLTMKTG